MNRTKKKRLMRDVQGYMALCVFGCHCGETAEKNDYRGSFIMAHLREKHPAMWHCAMNPRLTFKVEYR